MAPRAAGDGPREQRRARIEQTALTLFRARGFDQVTVEDVSAAAGVAPATFYRYFGTKEEVVFAYRDAFATALGAAVDQAAAFPVGEQLTAVLHRFAEFLEHNQEVVALRDPIVLSHPRLLQGTLGVQRELEGHLAAGLARNRGLDEPDPAVLLEAGTGMLVLRVAVRTWRMRGEGSLVEAVRETLHGLGALAARISS
jgi:AcrR family transcriptional regulator